MSESELPSAESSENHSVDYIIQRKWDQFAVADFAVGPESSLSTQDLASRDEVHATMSINSLPADDSATALGGAIAKADSPGITDREFDSPDRGPFDAAN